MSLHRPDEWVTWNCDQPPADRLASLEEAGIVWREAVPPPVAATLYHLTDAGADLEPVLDALGIWGARFMSEKDETDQFRSHWFKRPVSMFLKDHAPDGPPVSIQLSPEDYPAVIETSQDGIQRDLAGLNPLILNLLGPHISSWGSSRVV